LDALGLQVGKDGGVVDGSGGANDLVRRHGEFNYAVFYSPTSSGVKPKATNRKTISQREFALRVPAVLQSLIPSPG
jgi:hypothetical protein